MGARTTEVVVALDMTDQDSPAVDQSNHAETDRNDEINWQE